MKQFICDFKENKLLKLYLTIFSLINLIYIFFEVSKSKYIKSNFLEGTIEMYQYQHLADISKITSFMESLIILIYLVYLIKVIIKKDKINIKQYLFCHFVFFTVLIFISYLVSFVFLGPIGNLTQQLFGPCAITFIVLIYFIVNISYKKCLKILKL